MVVSYLSDGYSKQSYKDNWMRNHHTVKTFLSGVQSDLKGAPYGVLNILYHQIL
jgi:hypothetical protein